MKLTYIGLSFITLQLLLAGWANAQENNSINKKPKQETTMHATTPVQSDFRFNKKYQTIDGLKMAYIDTGAGDPIIFLHGNPASGYIWRNIIPHLQHLGRCIAPDLMGMGDSDKFGDEKHYTFDNNEKYLGELFNKLELHRNIIFVVHDWGSVLAFDWARKHPGAVKGIVYMEAITRPRSWEEVPGVARETFKKLRTVEGEKMVLQENSFIEFNLPKTVIRTLSHEEMAEYRRPFSEPGESRRAMLNWARQLPLGGAPENIIRIVNENSKWLAESNTPKLFIEACPGTLADAEKSACMLWPNQTHVIVKGHHNLQEDAPEEIGTAIALWLQKLP